jgi:regulator of protease activity HflC (stomatin/prohibitin superfamily)
MKIMAVDQSSSRHRYFRYAEPLLPSRRVAYGILLTILAALYWGLVWYMERIDLAQYDFPIALPLPQSIINLTTAFLPRVLRHFIPVILGIWLAFEVAANFLYYLYDLPSHGESRRFLLSLRSPGSFWDQTVVVQPQTLEKQREESALFRAGGPGQFIIPAGHAAVTEQNGRYFRIVGEGPNQLQNFEYIHTILDLRRQDREKENVQLRSHEGLELTADVGVSFQIDTGRIPARQQKALPYDPQTIRELAYAQTNLPEERISGWDGIALSKVIDILRQKIMHASIDQLLDEPNTEIGAHIRIRDYVEGRARKNLGAKGIKLHRVRLGHFVFSDDVTNQHIDRWRAFLRGEADEEEFFALDEAEKAREKAETKLARELIDGMKRAKQQGHEGTASVEVAINSIEALESVAKQSRTETFVRASMLEELKAWRIELQGNGDQDEVNDQDPDGQIIVGP